MDLKKLKNKNILVTGGAGFVGSNLCDKLVEIDANVFCLDNLSTGKKENISHLLTRGNFTFIQGDITDYGICLKSTKGVEFVLHQAALGSVPRSIKDPIATNKSNIDGFLNILNASVENNVKKFVYAASSSTYGDSKILPKEEEVIGKPLSPYAITKYVNELYASVFSSLYGIETIGLRYFNVFGKRQDINGPYAAVIPKFIDSLMKYKSPMVNGDGSYSRDFTHIDNVVQMNLLVLLNRYPKNFSQVYNTAAGERTTILELFNKIIEVISKYDKNIQTIKPKFGTIRVGDVPHSLASIKKAKKDLGYKPIVKVSEGIEKTVEWFYYSNK